MRLPFNSIRLHQQHAGRIKKKLHPIERHGHTCNAGKTQDKNTPIERPAPSGEFLAADIDRLLAAQVTRLIVGNQLGPVRTSLCRRRRVSLYGLHAIQTTTSFSRTTPYVFCTLSRTSAISLTISLAAASPAFTNTLALRSLTRASPTDRPLRPHSSIMRPA